MGLQRNVQPDVLVFVAELVVDGAVVHQQHRIYPRTRHEGHDAVVRATQHLLDVPGPESEVLAVVRLVTDRCDAAVTKVALQRSVEKLHAADRAIVDTDERCDLGHIAGQQDQPSAHKGLGQQRLK